MQQVVWVTQSLVERWRYRWFGRLVVTNGEDERTLPMIGTVAQWFQPDEQLVASFVDQANDSPGFQDYALWRPTENGT
ncbi:MAG: ABC transporter ATP-binding protein, partial [Thermomicrobium sp.]